MSGFDLNGIHWKLELVEPDSPMLVDRTNTLTVATTDPSTRTIYLSNKLSGNFKMRVIIHELGHCALISYGLLDDIHRVVIKDYWVEAEEWVCNFIADYGMEIFKTAYSIYGENALKYIPYELDKVLVTGDRK